MKYKELYYQARAAYWLRKWLKVFHEETEARGHIWKIEFDESFIINLLEHLDIERASRIVMVAGLAREKYLGSIGYSKECTEKIKAAMERHSEQLDSLYPFVNELAVSKEDALAALQKREEQLLEKSKESE